MARDSTDPRELRNGTWIGVHAAPWASWASKVGGIIFSRIVVAIVAAVLLALVGVMHFLVVGGSWAEGLDKEIYKLTYQFLLFIVIGGALSLLYQRFTALREAREGKREREREAREQRRLRLQTIHRDLLSVFNRVKKARRLLRALAVTSLDDPTPSAEVVNADEYAKQMLAIIEAQLILETYVKESKADRLFESIPGLGDALKRAEKYLGSLIGEFEEHLREFQGIPKTRPLAKLDELRDFIAHKEASKNFKPEFTRPFREALDALENALFDGMGRETPEHPKPSA